MAKEGQSVIDFTVTNRPPSGKVRTISSNGFQYRGKIFKGLHEKQEKRPALSEKYEDIQSCNSKTFHPMHQRQIQSAKGRMEGNIENSSKEIQSASQLSNLVTSDEKNKASVIDMNLLSYIPDYEEQMLQHATSVRAAACNSTTDFLTSVALRPSSAKSATGSPVVKVDDENLLDTSRNIKPSVYGLRVGRQVFGCEPDVLEAWKDIKKEFPYKLSDEDAHQQSDGTSNKSLLPSTLQPLYPWLQKEVPSSIIGMDPSLCYVFLSHDYQDVDLPEVPSPQDPSEDLPYSCLVETPRVPIMKKYSHSSSGKDDDFENTYKCLHSEKLKPSYNGDISNLLQRPYIRSPEKIRKEITELEELLNGIGNLASKCSFVQFQAEIAQAKELAAKLYKLRPREEHQEPIDTFGLLKIYKDHELILAALQQRRNDCLEELALLERN